MTMVNTIGGLADAQVVAPQLAQGVNFADHLHLLQTFTGIDAQKATTLAEQLQEVQDLLVEPDVVTTIAETNGVDPKKLALAMQLITKRSAAGTIPGAATIAQQSHITNPDGIVADLTGHVSYAVTPVAPPMKQETLEEKVARLENEKLILENKQETIEMLNPVNVVTSIKAGFRERRLRKSIRKGNNERVLQKQFGYPILRWIKDLPPGELAAKMQAFELQHGPAKRAHLPVKARRRTEKQYKYVTSAYAAYLGSQKAFTPQ